LTGRRYRGASWNFATSHNFANNMPRSGGFMNHNSAIGTPKAIVPTHKISHEQMEDRRNKGLRYNCDAKWQYGHKYQNPKIFLLEGLEMLEENPTLESKNEDLKEINVEEENPKISLHAITGSNHSNTMRLIG
jgi:hypothetical protein